MNVNRASETDFIGRVPLARSFGRREGPFVDKRTDSDDTENVNDRRERPADNLIVFHGKTLEPDADIALTPGVDVASSPLNDLKRKVRSAFFAEVETSALTNKDDAQIRVILDEYLVDYLDQEKLNLSVTEQQQVLRLLCADVLGYGPLETLLSDSSVTDILVNGHEQIWVERFGKLELSEVSFDDESHLRNLIDRILATVHRRVDEANPLVDARLPDGSRINVAIPPVSFRFTSMSIRKFMEKHVTLDDLVKLGSLSFKMATMLKLAAKHRLNIIVSGGTGAGKTTLLQAICHHASARERIVTIEDTAELQLQQPDVVSLETRPPNMEGKGEVTISDLLRNALRMRPDRIILGEVRGEEAADMLQAMNTGHDGSIGTLHANSARDALSRFEYMVSMSSHYEPGRITRQQIVNAIDLVVHIERMKDGVRRIQSITEVTSMENETLLTRDLAIYNLHGESEQGDMEGEFEISDLQPEFLKKISKLQMTGEEAELINHYETLGESIMRANR